MATEYFWFHFSCHTDPINRFVFQPYIHPHLGVGLVFASHSQVSDTLLLNHPGDYSSPSAGRSYVWGCRLIHPELGSLDQGGLGNVMLAWLQVLKEPPRVPDFVSSCSHSLLSLLVSGLRHSFLAQKNKAVSDNAKILWASVALLPSCLHGNWKTLPSKFPPATPYPTQQYTKLSPL